MRVTVMGSRVEHKAKCPQRPHDVLAYWFPDVVQRQGLLPSSPPSFLSSLLSQKEYCGNAWNTNNQLLRPLAPCCLPPSLGSPRGELI